MTVRATFAAALIALTLIGGCGGPSATIAPGPTSTSVPTATSVRPTATLPPLTGSGGGRIVFSSRRGEGDYAIYVMNADGTDKRRLTRNPFEDEEAVWSPDGSQIAFNIDNYAGRVDIYVMNADGSDLRQLTTKGNAGGPAWSPDGTRIAFARYQSNGSADLYVINADGTDERRLTQARNSQVFSPAWSPDGTHIVCVVDSSTEPLAEESTICVLNVEEALRSGGVGIADLRPLPRAGEEVNDRPDWSPTGSRIVFSAVVDNRRDIYVVNADGTNLQQITETKDFDEWAPAWSPDGTQIVFQANPDAQWDIYVMNADGTGRRHLTTDVANDTTPDWVR
jgi:TolB protein